MGVGFTALLHFSKDLDYQKFANDIGNNNLFPQLNLINNEYKNLNAKLSVFDNKYITLDYGTVDLSFNEYNVACIRIDRYWSHFLSHNETRLLLKGICFEIAKYFNQDRVVYLPDHWGLDYVFSEYCIEEIIESLNKRFGNPPNEIESIYKEFEEHIETDGYYIEIFNS
ncbi:hypothetical protein [Paenibacillus arenosi]|uniref:Uncharacterized protein n=1 Tax=Paenibacillus arenosi TaxID=2774142 RepID=A0ABR9ATM9_9BACL|nr:hypothetical protein [Paenibacillus arenosi]MBD8497246.1 hypothetical protein [Paenibacillus arenosi]